MSRCACRKSPSFRGGHFRGCPNRYPECPGCHVRGCVTCQPTPIFRVRAKIEAEDPIEYAFTSRRERRAFMDGWTEAMRLANVGTAFSIRPIK